MKKFYLFLLVALSSSLAVLSQAISLTGPDYIQNFNTLSNTAGSTTNSLTITGWFMTESGGGARDNEQYAVDNGASTTGDTYSYGSPASTDRALGNLRSGTLISLIGAAFTNNTGATLSFITVSYTGEEWRFGTTGRADRLDFQYSLNATDLVTGTWTDVNSLDFSTPDLVTVGAKNGNAASDRTARSATINGLAINAGATFWIRWVDIDATGPDDGLAVDDFTLSTSTILPVTISRFLVMKENGTSKIAWTTTAEINSREFIVERSGSSESGWQTIATIPATGQTGSSTDYLVYDNHPLEGSNFYRLKSVDLDNKFYLSGILRIDFANRNKYAIFPNPSKDNLQIESGDPRGFNGQLAILNTRGQTILRKQVRDSNSIISLDISPLETGLYFLKLTDRAGETVIMKFIRN